MSQLKKIIVGDDLRAGGELARRAAAALATRCGATLRLVHVVEPPHYYQRVTHPLTSPYTIEEISQRVGEKLQAITAGPDFARLQAEYEVRRGKPFVELIIARRAWQADLIVVGSAHEDEAHFLGSTSERVVRKAMVPVLVAKKLLSGGGKTILVPTDFSDCARKAAEEAISLAESFSCPILFLHVVDLYPLYANAYADDMELLTPLPAPSSQELESEWQAFLSRLPLEKIDWKTQTEEGQAAMAIIRRAEQAQADMIVMGTHGRTGLEYMLMGSVAEKVVRTAKCSILTIRPEAFRFEIP